MSEKQRKRKSDTATSDWTKPRPYRAKAKPPAKSCRLTKELESIVKSLAAVKQEMEQEFKWEDEDPTRFEKAVSDVAGLTKGIVCNVVFGNCNPPVGFSNMDFLRWVKLEKPEEDE